MGNKNALELIMTINLTEIFSRENVVIFMSSNS